MSKSRVCQRAGCVKEPGVSKSRVCQRDCQSHVREFDPLDFFYIALILLRLYEVNNKISAIKMMLRKSYYGF